MTGAIGLLILVVVLAAIMFAALIDSQIIVAFLLQKVLEPFVRWYQRLLFGIDRVRAGTETLIGSQAALNSLKAAGSWAQWLQRARDGLHALQLPLRKALQS